jgi:hypothetical protein
MATAGKVWFVIIFGRILAKKRLEWKGSGGETTVSVGEKDSLARGTTGWSEALEFTSRLERVRNAK